jgi:putative oxidoreductase
LLNARGRLSFLLKFCINNITVMKKIFSIGQSIAPFLLRLFLALVLFPHGVQKLLGWLGGFGFNGTMAYFTETVKLPWIIGFLVIVIEFFSPIALLLGFAVRLWSFVIAIVMAGIILTHFTGYFFMNWFGNQKPREWSFSCLLLA